jgi:hypothetical protein
MRIVASAVQMLGGIIDVVDVVVVVVGGGVASLLLLSRRHLLSRVRPVHACMRRIQTRMDTKWYGVGE